MKKAKDGATAPKTKAPNKTPVKAQESTKAAVPVPTEPTLRASEDALKRVKSYLKKPTDPKYSPFGHKMTSDSGRIDVAILDGCLDLATLADVCCGFSNTSKKTRDSFQSRCRRVRNHEHWKASTAGRKGKGLDTRLKNVYADEATTTGKAIATDLAIIFAFIAAQYRKLFPKKVPQKAAVAA